MRIERLPNHDIHISNEIYFLSLYPEFRYLGKDFPLNHHLEGIYDRLGLSFGKKEERDYFLNLCADYKGISKKDLKVGILDAHGSSSGGIWKFRDLFRKHLVQKWIDQQGDQYTVLLLHVCNHDFVKPTTKNSILVVPQGEISIQKSYRDLENLIVFPNKTAIPINGRKVVHNPQYNFLTDASPYAS